jgi:CHASE3 domain sensor protein
MKEEQVLSELKDKVESLKRSIAVKEGSLDAMLARVKNDFGAKSIDDACKKLAAMKADAEAKIKQRNELLGIASDMLAECRKQL